MIEVKVLGTGFMKCNKLYGAAEKAIASSGVQAVLSKVEKIDDIISYGVAITPALVVAGEVKSSGKIPNEAEIMTWLTTAAMKS